RTSSGACWAQLTRFEDVYRGHVDVPAEVQPVEARIVDVGGRVFDHERVRGLPVHQGIRVGGQPQISEVTLPPLIDRLASPCWTMCPGGSLSFRRAFVAVLLLVSGLLAGGAPVEAGSASAGGGARLLLDPPNYANPLVGGKTVNPFMLVTTDAGGAPTYYA